MDKPQIIDFDTATMLINDPCAFDQLVETLGEDDMNRARFFTVGTTVFCDASLAHDRHARGVLWWDIDEETWRYITGG